MQKKKKKNHFKNSKNIKNHKMKNNPKCKQKPIEKSGIFIMIKKVI